MEPPPLSESGRAHQVSTLVFRDSVVGVADCTAPSVVKLDLMADRLTLIRPQSDAANSSVDFMY